MPTTLPPFQTELFFTDYEFTAPHILAASDCQTLSVGELLELAQASPQDLMNVQLGYTESWGHPELRKKVAARYRGLSAENVLVLSSPIEGLYLLNQLFDQETIVLTPAYDALKNLPKNLKSWSLVPTEDSWRLDFEALEKLASESTQLLVVNFPHNPTGFVPSPQDWERICQWANERGLRLFCDEMYAGLYRTDTAPISSVVEQVGHNILLGGLSKSHGLPGLRAGWLVSKDRDLLQQLHDLKLYTSICPAGPVEYLADCALSIESTLVKRSNRQIESNLKLADDFFAEHSDLFRWRRPLGGSVALVELLGVDSAELWARQMADEHGVVLLPGTFLGFPDRYVRFGFGRASFSQDLAALEAALNGC
jgi:aspartate/methionine/tyrosine aminotransferase